VYEYTVDHLNGETTTVEANDHYHHEGFLILVNIPSVHEVSMGAGRLSPPWNMKSWNKVTRLEGIQEWDREPIGKDIWSATWSKADGSLTDITREYEER